MNVSICQSHVQSALEQKYCPYGNVIVTISDSIAAYLRKRSFVFKRELNLFSVPFLQESRGKA